MTDTPDNIIDPDEVARRLDGTDQPGNIIDLEQAARRLDGSKPRAADEGHRSRLEVRPPARPPFPFKLVDELDPQPRKIWLVRDMFGAGELSAIYGEPKSGKSVLAADLAFHVSAGIPWQGRAVQAGAVIYVAAERAKLTERRLTALRQRNELAEPKLAILDGHFDFFSGSEDADRLAATVEAVAQKTGAPVVLIIVDTVARVIPGADENHSRDIGKFVANMDHVRRATGAHVLVIHHDSKDKTKGMRGSTALLGAVDATMFVEKLEGERFATLNYCNDGDEGARISFALEGVELFVDPETGEATTAPIVVAKEDTKPAKTAGRSMSPIERIAVDCLLDAMLDHGRERPHGAPEIPLSVPRVVDEQHWRELIYQKTRSPDENPNTARVRFNRVRDRLIATHAIGKSGEWIWPAK